MESQNPQSTSSTVSEMGFIKTLLLVGLVIILGIVVYSVYLQSVNNDFLAAARTFHKDMRTKSAAEVYQSLCPVFREKTSLNKFTEAYSTYSRASSDEMLSTPRETSLDADTFKKGAENGAGDGASIFTYGALVYGTGKLNVGVAVVNSNDSSCIHSFALETL
jgi:hypothetical protein